MMSLMKIGNYKGLEMNGFNNSFENMQTQETSLKLLICFSSFLTFQKQMFISAYIEEESPLIPILNWQIFSATHLINILFLTVFTHALSGKLLGFALTQKDFDNGG